MRQSDSRKGQNGKVLIIAGSEQYVGAAYLTAVAALRTGVDLVHLACAEKAAFIVNGMASSIITHKLPGSSLSKKHIPALLEICKKVDVVVIGPGLGESTSIFGAVKEFLKKNTLPVVIDADAIKAMKRSIPHNCIITPHSKELEYIAGSYEDVGETIINIAKEDKVILFKGNPDFITDGKRIEVNQTGNASMTKGGTGDILAGLCGGLWALVDDPFVAARLAAAVNGICGEWLYKESGYGYLSEEILGEIPHALEEVVKWKKK
mgnify:FL=1